jgi:hypothetical protein
MSGRVQGVVKMCCNTIAFSHYGVRMCLLRVTTKPLPSLQLLNCCESQAFSTLRKIDRVERTNGH